MHFTTTITFLSALFGNHHFKTSASVLHQGLNAFFIFLKTGVSNNFAKKTCVLEAFVKNNHLLSINFFPDSFYFLP